MTESGEKRLFAEASETKSRNFQATFAQKSLGIGHAKALSVHLANPRVTKECWRRWTGFAVALTVTFTACDARQIGLSPSDPSFLPPIKSVAFFQIVRPEQKAPPVLAPMRISDQVLVSRKQASGAPRSFDGLKYFRYVLISPSYWLNVLCPQPNSGESTRGPPRMDPPTFC